MKWTAQVHERLGHRGECLLFFGGLDLVYAWSMLTSDPNMNATYRWFNSIGPGLDAWAALWAFVGVTCIYHAFHRYDRFGFAAAIGIKMIWGLFSAIGTTAGITFGSVGIWLGLAGLVWRISGWAETMAERTDERKDEA